MSTLQKRYDEEIRKVLKERFGYSNSMLIPTLKKVVISMGVGEALKDKTAMEDCVRHMTLLSGQKPIFTLAKKSIAGFKLREKQPVGIKVTLRRKRMYDFVYRFCHIVTPRIRDFRGLKFGGDGRGSCSIGLSTQEAFPEIHPDDLRTEQGMNITLVTSATNNEECYALLEQLGVPFKEGK